MSVEAGPWKRHKQPVGGAEEGVAWRRPDMRARPEIKTCLERGKEEPFCGGEADGP